jgi:hypothetical protein
MDKIGIPLISEQITNRIITGLWPSSWGYTNGSDGMRESDRNAGGLAIYQGVQPACL